MNNCNEIDVITTSYDNSDLSAYSSSNLTENSNLRSLNLPTERIVFPDTSLIPFRLKNLKNRVKHSKDYDEAVLSDNFDRFDKIPPNKKAPRKNWKSYSEETIEAYLGDRYDNDTVFVAENVAYSYTCAVIGPKEQMQDRTCTTYLSIDTNSTGDRSNIPFYGVFDGHGNNENGDECAEFLSNNFPRILGEKLQFTDLNDDNDISQAVNAGFLEIDALYRESTKQKFVGSTALVAFILNGCLWLANAGDSRAVLSNNENLTQLTVDAAPTIKLFKKSLEERGWSSRFFWFDEASNEVKSSPFRPKARQTKGAQVFPKCINSKYPSKPTLSPARTIGDKVYKGISPLPRITKYPLNNGDLDDGEDCHLILATDGLWDVLSSVEAVDILNAIVKRETDDVTKIKASAEALVRAAFTLGAYDNTSVMVIKLQGNT